MLDPKMNPSKWALGRGRNFGMGRDCLGRFLAQLHTHPHTHTHTHTHTHPQQGLKPHRATLSITLVFIQTS